MNTAKFCIRHKVSTLLAVIMIAAFGAVFTSQLQLALLPDMEAPMAVVYSYYNGASYINTMLGPATACLAVNVYNKRDLLKKYWLPVLAGCLAGTVTSIGSILVLSRLFGLDKDMTASLLPKSVTTPIATAVSEGHGGIVPITVAAVIVTGILGNLAAPFLVKLFRVKDPVAAGLGIGTCSHALGTAKALEMGETEGAMSGLAVGICGIFTALLALGFDLIL